MSEIKIIKTKEDYEEALKLVESLIDRDPDAESTEGAQLALLATLIKDYESRAFPEHLPDPVEAIKFRMEQADLKPADLVPYIGSRGRVSEVLSGKRQLTLEMVRALEAGLGIPAKVLIQKPSQDAESQYQHWDTQLVRAMEQYGYFGNKSLKEHDKSELISEFFALTGGIRTAALFRKTNYRIAPRTDKNALDAWMLRVWSKAKKIKTPVKYKPGTVNLTFMQDIVKFSVKDKSPILAQDHLKKHGIKLVIEPHLPKTHLDGATLLMEKDNPVIGMTLRRNRLDNFWFTLMHELAHIARHYDKDVELFYDEELQHKAGIEIDAKESEADALAEDAILPENTWEISNARITPTAMATQSLANELGIHVAVIAGIVQYKHQNFYYLNKIINDESVRVQKYFPEVFKVKV